MRRRAALDECPTGSATGRAKDVSKEAHRHHRIRRWRNDGSELVALRQGVLPKPTRLCQGVRWSDRDSKENNQRCSNEFHYSPPSPVRPWRATSSDPCPISGRICPTVGSKQAPQTERPT